jgi:hypothetical protein
MEARSIEAGLSAHAAAGEATRPRAKDGGMAAGKVAIIRELEHLLSGAGGLVVVAIGLIAVMTITSASLGTVAEEERATVVTAAFTVLGTIVGAYFGVRVGARGKDEAGRARRGGGESRAPGCARGHRGSRSGPRRREPGGPGRHAQALTLRGRRAHSTSVTSS